MESQDASAQHGDASRPSLGFPLGTALLLIIIFSLSGIFSCCYHWDKLRSFRRQQSQSFSDPESANSHTQSFSPPFNPKLHSTTELKQSKGQSIPVLMPGDDIPKFMAMPCPCQPSRLESIVVTVEKPPPKPPRLPVPLY